MPLTIPDSLLDRVCSGPLISISELHEQSALQAPTKRPRRTAEGMDRVAGMNCVPIRLTSTATYRGLGMCGRRSKL